MQRKLSAKPVYLSGRNKSDREFIYLHMSNHYRRIVNAKKAIDNSPPSCFKGKRPCTSNPGISKQKVNRHFESLLLTDRSLSTNSNKDSWGTDSFTCGSRYHARCVPDNSPNMTSPKLCDIDLIERITYDTKHGPSSYTDKCWSKSKEHNEKRNALKDNKSEVKHSAGKRSLSNAGHSERTQKRKLSSQKMSKPSQVPAKGTKSMPSVREKLSAKVLKKPAVSKLRSLRVYHPPRRVKSRPKTANSRSYCKCTKICLCDDSGCVNESASKKMTLNPKEHSVTSSRDSAYNGGISSVPESRSPTPDHRSKKDCCCCCCERMQRATVLFPKERSNATTPRATTPRATSPRASSPRPTTPKGRTPRSRSPRPRNNTPQSEVRPKSATGPRPEMPLKSPTGLKSAMAPKSAKALTINTPNSGSEVSLPKTRIKCTERDRDPYEKMQDDALYVSFVQDITTEVLEKNLYTNKALKNVMKKHLQKNLKKLDKDRMLQELEHLRMQLGIPEDQSLFESAVETVDSVSDLNKCNYPVISDSEFSFPVEDILPQVEDILPQVEDMLNPVENMMAPVENMMAPVEDMLAPVEDMIDPVEEMMAPAEDMISPAEDIIPPEKVKSPEKIKVPEKPKVPEKTKAPERAKSFERPKVSEKGKFSEKKKPLPSQKSTERTKAAGQATCIYIKPAVDPTVLQTTRLKATRETPVPVQTKTACRQLSWAQTNPCFHPGTQSSRAAICFMPQSPGQTTPCYMTQSPGQTSPCSPCYVTQSPGQTTPCYVTQSPGPTTSCFITPASEQTASCYLPQSSGQPTSLSPCYLPQSSGQTTSLSPCYVSQSSEPTTPCFMAQTTEPTTPCFMAQTEQTSSFTQHSAERTPSFTPEPSMVITPSFMPHRQTKSLDQSLSKQTLPPFTPEPSMVITPSFMPHRQTKSSDLSLSKQTLPTFQPTSILAKSSTQTAPSIHTKSSTQTTPSIHAKSSMQTATSIHTKSSQVTASSIGKSSIQPAHSILGKASTQTAASIHAKSSTQATTQSMRTASSEMTAHSLLTTPSFLPPVTMETKVFLKQTPSRKQTTVLSEKVPSAENRGKNSSSTERFTNKGEKSTSVLENSKTSSETDNEFSGIPKKKSPRDRRKDESGSTLKNSATHSRDMSSEDSDRPSEPKKRSYGKSRRQKYPKRYTTSSSDSEMSGCYSRTVLKENRKVSPSKDAYSGGSSTPTHVRKKSRSVSFWRNPEYKTYHGPKIKTRKVVSHSEESFVVGRKKSPKCE